MENRLDPELKETFLKLPLLFEGGKITTSSLNHLRKTRENNLKLNTLKHIPPHITTTKREIPGPKNAPNVRIKIYQPKEHNEKLPGLLYMHGGGYLFGSPDAEDNVCFEILEKINCVIISVDYRLAPEHPFPAAIEDCYAALQWFSKNAHTFNVDNNRIAITGPSAGGGLTACLALLARDRKGPSIIFQSPRFPMLDNRCITPSSQEITDSRVWNYSYNRQAWSLYLGSTYSEVVSPYAAAIHAKDLSGLPPTYICIGDLDPFRDETITYVLKLRQAGVPTEFHLYPGGFHGFEDYAPYADISQRAKKEYYRALKKGMQKK